MIFLTSTAGRFSKGPQRLIGEFIIVSAGLVLVWVSHRILYRRAEAEEEDSSGSRTESFLFRTNLCLMIRSPKDIEDDFYK